MAVDPLRRDSILRARNMSPGEKAWLTLELMRLGIELRRAGIRARRPDATEEEVDLELDDWLINRGT